ncbi:MAG: endonuclease/exonuclease/phosphatase family protein [Bacteroidia bacterium]|nr:endonuclease/exonuclease/phosphatase family protein [Bacteroidia bacterium]
MNKILLIVCFSLVAISASFSQTDFRIMFYNVENLFDTVDDPDKNDDEFLPGAGMNWTPWKYWEKLRNITRVITAVGGMQSPALVGLCEIENDSVVFDLTRRSPLRAQSYEYIVTNSPDDRGIDVALLYQRHQFNLLQHHEYEIVFQDKTTRPTRNLLHAVGRIISGDTLDIFVCHWPSRSGGQRETEPARIHAAALLRNKVDSLFVVREKANIVVMGDFNDHPDNRSIFQTLGARSLNYHRSDKELYNMFFHRLKERNFGTYFFQGRWGMLDQFIVSGNLLADSSSVRIKNSEAHIFKPDFLLEDDPKFGGKRPYRTHLGPRYIGGFSDHLPVYMDLSVEH